jgi:hypothetical protein
MQLPYYKSFTKEQMEQFGPPKKAKEFKTFTRVYETPFVYENLEVCGFYEIDPTKGIEFKADEGYITVVEDKPIVAVTVVGSGCTRGGYNAVEWWDEGESIDEMKDQLVKRQLVEHLNGMHPSVWIEILRNAPWTRGLFEGKPITQPNISDGAYKDNINMIKHNTFNYYMPFEISLYENTAYFRVGTKDNYPKKVTIRSGCKGTEDPGTEIERYPADYAIRLVEVTLMDV